jgi:hypothetical protein
MADTAVYWISPLGDKDDFGVPYGDEMIDGRTRHGPWANMTPSSWAFEGGTGGRLGPGMGQRYKKQDDGRWLKVEG